MIILNKTIITINPKNQIPKSVAAKAWIDEIIPLSAQSAMVIYEKTTGKKALAHFIHIRKQKRWMYYFMGAAHFLNLHLLTEKYADIEKHNFKLNFEHIPKGNHESNMSEM